MSIELYGKENPPPGVGSVPPDWDQVLEQLDAMRESLQHILYVVERVKTKDLLVREITRIATTALSEVDEYDRACRLAGLDGKGWE